MGKAKRVAGPGKIETSGMTEYRPWLAKLPYPVVLLRQDNLLIYVNTAFTRLTGFLKNELAGKSPPFAFWPDDQNIRYSTDLQRKNLRSKRLFCKKNGETFWADLTLGQVENKGFSYRLLTFHPIPALERSRPKYQIPGLQLNKILDAIPIPVSITTFKDMKFTQVNTAFEQISGFGREELIGRRTQDLPWTGDQVGARRPDNLIRLGQIADIEMSLNSKTGEPRTSILKSSKVRFGSNDYMVAASIDITDRKKAEQTLIASEFRYQSTLENTLAGCQIIGFDWRYLFINKAAVLQGELKKEDVMGKTIIQVLPGIEQTELFQVMQDCLLNRVSGQIERESRHSDGSVRRFEWSIHPVPEGIFILSVDISARKLAESHARHLLVQQQAILDNIPDMAWLKDKELRFIAVNQALAKHANRPVAEILGKTEFDLFPAETARKFRLDDQQVIHSALGVTVEDTLSLPDGNTVWLETTKTPLFDEKQQVVGLAGISRDITIRKKSQLELQQLNQVLMAIRDVNRIITHEKDPQRLMEEVCRSLTSVRGFAACWIAQLDENNKLMTAGDSELGAAIAPKIDTLTSGILPNCTQDALSRGKAVIVHAGDPICQNCAAYWPIKVDSRALVMPFQCAGVVKGILTAIAGPTINIDEEEIRLVQQMTNDIGLALHNIWLEKQRAQAETELKISEDRFRVISEVAQDIIYRINLKPVLKADYISPSFVAVLGYSLDEVSAEHDWVLGLLHPDDQAIISKYLAHPSEVGPDPFVVRWRHKMGGYISLEHRHSVVAGADGQAVAVVGIGRDITQRIQIEETLKISETFSRGLSEESPNPILVVNEDGTIRYVNKALIDLTGFTKEEILGSQAPCLWWPEDKIEEYSSIAKRNHDLDKVDQEFVFRKKNGELFRVVLSITKVYRDGKVDYYLSTWVDITERRKVEEALRASERYNLALLNNAPIPILVLNEDTTIRYANPALFSLTGFSQEEIIGKSSPYPWWPGDRIAENQSIAENNRRLGIAEQERVFKKKNGELFWALVSVRSIRNNGILEYTLSSWIDITERKNAEQALQESEKYSAGLISNAPNPILVTNPNGTIKYVNQALEMLSGFSNQELVGRSIPYPWWPESLVELFLAENRQNPGRRNLRFERQYRRKNGQDFWVALSFSTIPDENQKVKFYITNWVDITERKKAEQALQQSEGKNRLIFASIGDGILIADLLGNILDCNQAAVRMSGVSKSEVVGRNIEVFLQTMERQRAFANIQKTILEGSSGHIQYHLLRPDGASFPVDTTANIARDHDGNPLYLVVSFQDITERKQMEDRILDLYETEKKQREELQEEAKARGMFIDVLAHELRTPLTPILASTGMLDDLLSNSQETILKKLCANISNGAEILAHRLEELLDVARYSRGVFHLNLSPVNLPAFIDDALSRFKPSLDQRRQYLISNISTELPLALIDPSRMEQVIINLLSNASKFSFEQGKIFFSAIYQDEALKIEVRDEGIGITPEEQSRLFQPYHRVEQDRQKFPGIGLGLAVSKQIVEAHGGAISVRSQLGQGSVFILSIPIKQYTV